MKKYLSILVVMIVCLTTSKMTLIANENSELIKLCAGKIVEDRVYLKPGIACISQKEIFVKVDEAVIPLEAVYCDQEGLFIYAYQLGAMIECDTCRRFYDPQKQRAICPHKFYWE